METAKPVLPHQQFETTEKTSFRIPVGILFMMSSALLFSALTFLIKILGTQYRVWDIAMYRFCGGALLLYLLFGRNRLFRTKSLPLMLSRGVSGSLAFLLLVLALQRIPMTTVMVLFYSFPAFAAIFSPLLFKEPITPKEIFFVLIALVGVGVLFGFKFSGPFPGQLMSVVSGIFAGLTVTLIKKLKANHHSANIYFYFCLIGAGIALIPYAKNPVLPKTFVEIGIVGGIIVTASIAQLMMNKGFQYCKSWEGGTFLTSELLFTTLLGVLILGEDLSWRFYVGGILIFGSAVAFNIKNGRIHAR